MISQHVQFVLSVINQSFITGHVSGFDKNQNVFVVMCRPILAYISLITSWYIDTQVLTFIIYIAVCVSLFATDYMY